MDEHALLKAVYQSIQWDKLYELAPGAERQEVDELFQQLRRELRPSPEPDLADEVAGGEAVVRSDGASKGNPGPAGIGAVIQTADGREVVAWGKSIGRATNNVAEYRAAIEGLQRALELGVRRVRLLADSELLVRQVNGEYRVKSPGLQPLHTRVLELLNRFDDWTVSHAGRDENTRADALAGEHAKEAGAGG